MAKQPPGKMHVKVFSPYQIFYEGEALSVSATNKTGPFDVLFDHSNFFSLLSPGIVRVNTGFEVLEVEISTGILKASSNILTLFANV